MSKLFAYSLFWHSLFLVLFSTGIKSNNDSIPFIQILGVAQDAGYPQMGCKKSCCERVIKDPTLKKFVVSLALVDPKNKKWWLIEATPDIKEQLQYFNALTKNQYSFLPNGIFITHAHIGHYTGLMQLGREVMNTKEMPVYVMPKMKTFLETSGPWSQLVSLKNISLIKMKQDSVVSLPGNIFIEPFLVPHRDEFSETAGFRIITPGKKFLFIPDIDKWEKWDKKIADEVARVDFALLDATFYSLEELPDRKIEEIPHPLVEETMKLLPKPLSYKVIFIHFNHTNPIFWHSGVQKLVKMHGFGVAEQGKKLF